MIVGRAETAVAGPFEIAVKAGEALVVTGPNGAGKSTLLRTLAGLLRPVGGAIRLNGLIAADGEPAARLADVAHYVGHRHGMKPQITIADNLTFWARYLGGAPGLRPSAALAAVGLAGIDDVPFGYLSAGQQRRASLARLAVVRRTVWILDEPTAALDLASQERFAGMVADHLRTGGIAIAATHHPLGLDQAETLHIPARDAASEAAMTIDEADLATAEGWL
nr:heme ABC exporter ATP-binding protein CcmA [Jiella flava]